MITLMRLTLAVATFAIGLGISPSVQALTYVPLDYPQQNQVGETQSAELPKTVAIYQNEIVLLAANPEGHEVQVKKLSVDPALVSSLSSQAGSPATLSGIIGALQKRLKANPQSAVATTIAAFKVARNAGLNGKAPISIVAGAIEALLPGYPTYAADVAALIGFAVAASPEEEQSEVLRQLRDLVLTQFGKRGEAEFAFSLDQALVEYGVVVPKFGTDNFLAEVAAIYPDGGLAGISSDVFETNTALFQIENGVYSPGDGATLVAPFTGGASGTPGNPGTAGNGGGAPPPPTPPGPPPAPPAS